MTDQTPYKSTVVLLTGPSPEGRREYMKFMDALVFMAEWSSPGSNIFWGDESDNYIFNGIRYVHGEHELDFIKDAVGLFIVTGTFDENPRAGKLFDAASKKTKIYGRMEKIPIPDVDEYKKQAMSV